MTAPTARPRLVAGVALALGAALLLLPRLALAQCPDLFDDPYHFNTGPNAVYMVAADFNEDGILDLAVTNANEPFTGANGASTVTVMIGQGNRQYSSTSYPTHNVSHGIVTADFNEDGILDLAIANKSRDVSILLGLGSAGVGNGFFGATTNFEIPGVGFDLDVADFDRDGHQDLTVCLNDQGAITFLRGFGDGTFSNWNTIWSTSAISSAIEAADFNQDGNPDVAVTQFSNGRVAVLLGNGQLDSLGKFSFQNPVNYVTDPQPFGLGVADVNEDGRLDLVVAHSVGNGIRIFHGTPTGTFVPGASLESGNSNATEVVDLDGDGHVDLATGTVTGYNDGTLEIYRGNGDGTFGPVEVTAYHRDVYQIVARDFDGDSRIDLFTAPAYGNEVSLLPGICGGSAVPRILVFDPPQAPAGHVITIEGQNFDGATDVRFNGTPATFTLDSDTRVRATVPAAATTGKVAITSPAGTGVSLRDFVVGPLPSFDAMVPAGGAPGAVITLQGNGFVDARSVRFNGTDATFQIDGPSVIRATVPPNAHTGYVHVALGAQTLVGPDSFVVAPHIATIGPSQGPAGTVVTILGHNFARASSVSFNGSAAGFTLVSDARIEATVPAAATTGPVVVTNPGGSGAFHDFFVGTLPEITSFSPAAGAPGTLVTIQGSGFAAVSSVRFGPAHAVYSVESDTEIRATVPNNARTGPIAMTARGATFTSADHFIVAPVVLGFQPSQAPAGHVITISGLNFSWSTSVRFAPGVEASFTVLDDGRIAATVPASAASGPLRVTNAGGFDDSSLPFHVGPLVGEGGGINLSWDDCGVAGLDLKSWACDTDLGAPFELIASFAPPTGVEEYLGLNAQLDLLTESATLPSWWLHGQSLCRGTTGIAVSFDFTSGPFTCVDVFSGQAAGGYVFETGFGSPNRARLRVTAAIPFDQRTPVAPATEYYAFKTQLRRTNTSSCGGCEVPTCIVLDNIQLFQPPERNFDPLVNTPLHRQHVTWQGTIPSCPLATPVLVSLVTAEAGPDGVELVWQTGDVERATVYRREDGAEWRALASLAPDGARRVRFEDADVTPGAAYQYRLGVVVGGTELFFGETRVEIPIAASLELSRAAWDPARRTVVVAFTLASREPAQVEIFDLAGRRWSSERLEGLNPGSHEVALGGARGLHPGVYFARLAQGASGASRRFVIVR